MWNHYTGIHFGFARWDSQAQRDPQISMSVSNSRKFQQDTPRRGPLWATQGCMEQEVRRGACFPFASFSQACLWEKSKNNGRGIQTLSQNLGGFVSLLNTHSFSSLVKEACGPLSLLVAPHSTRLKSSIDLQIAQPGSQLPWQLPPLRAQEPGEHFCLGIHWEGLLLAQTLSNPEQRGVKKNGSWTRAYNCRRSEWREEQRPSYPRENEFRIYLNHLVYPLSTRSPVTLKETDAY